MAVTAKEHDGIEAGLTFMYPSFVVPESFPSLYVFNRGR
jgi:hypothetical protein